ncbi:MAG: CvpA family protein [Planctomycetota bacterium]|nr:CvpA family protein [Planctomycetota bacterium]
MSVIDISVIIAIIACGSLGAWKGFAWQMAQMISITAAFLLATGGAPWVARRMMEQPNPFGRSVAWVAIFTVVGLAGYLLALRMKEKIAEYKLKAWDREMGAVLGALKGVILCSLVLFALAVPPRETRKRILDQSKVGAPFSVLLEMFHPYLPEDLHRQVCPKEETAAPGHFQADPSPPPPK